MEQPQEVRGLEDRRGCSEDLQDRCQGARRPRSNRAPYPGGPMGSRSLDFWLLLLRGQVSRSLPPPARMPEKTKPSPRPKHPSRRVSRAGKERHVSPSPDKNNWPWMLKPLSFVSQSRARTMALCVGASARPAWPAPSARPGRRPRRRARLGRGRGRWAARGCCWTAFRSPHSARLLPEEENKQPGSWKTLSPPAGGIAPPGSAQSQALPASSCHSGPGGLGTRSPSQGPEGGTQTLLSLQTRPPGSSP